MTGFITDYVNQIAINLRDRYKTGFPILKELVQNADDAGAKSLAFGYHSGHDIADHMLLKGPALWVLNNGKFKSSDQQAIRSFGLNAKAGDSGVIGKFGLGMKSVFHLCESFFYLARHDGKLFYDFLNPWFGDDQDCSAMHKQWEIFTSIDEKCLESVALTQPEASTEKDWFLLWVPLRKRSHVPCSAERPMAPIIERYPGERGEEDLDFFSDPLTDQRIGGLLPLLRNLEQVRFAGTEMREPFLVTLMASPSKHRLDHETDGIQICGLVSDDRQSSAPLHFLARQRVAGHVFPFDNLRKSRSWPSSMVITEPRRPREPRPDKATAEAAVMFAHADKRTGRLDLQWAVFLPAEEQRYSYEANIPESSREYRMVLHGQFFVDAGRRGIGDMDVLHQNRDTLPDSPSQHLVLKHWNQALAQQVVLPEILPALSEYVKFAKLKNDEIKALTAAISNCSAEGDGGSRILFFANFQQFICERFSWILRIKRDGRVWALIDSTLEQILSIPNTRQDDPERPWRALPGLASLSGYAFAAAGVPSLSSGEATWQPDLLLIALQDINLNIFKNEVDFEYLASFLELQAEKFVNADSVQDALVNILRKCLLKVSLSEVRSNRKIFKRIVKVLSPDRVFAFGTKDQNAKGAIPEHFYRTLLNTATKALAVPGDLGPDGVTTCPSDEDLIAWLVSLDRLNSDILKAAVVNKSQFLDAAEQLIRASGDEDSQLALLRQCRRLRVLRAFNGDGAGIVIVSLEELMDSHERGLLFKVVDPNQPLGLVPRLAHALPEIQVLVVRAAVASYITELSDRNLRSVSRSDDENALLRVVGAESKPPFLGDITCRSNLLALVAKAKLDDPTIVQGVRYLLHGSAEHYSRNDVLWKDPVGQKSPWVRLWQMIDESPWRVLLDSLCSSIPDKCAPALNIKAVDEASVLNRLAVCTDFSRVESAQFTAEEIDLLLGRIVEKDPWLLLPLHQDLNGNRIAIDNECFLGSDPLLPIGFDHTIRFIERSPALDHFRQQQKLLSVWDAKSAASIVLASDNPGQYWRYLLGLLQTNPNFVDEDFRSWYEVEWLPLTNKRFISLSSLIFIKNLNSEISALAQSCDYAYATPGNLVAELQDHPAFTFLLAHVSSGEDALPVLGQLMTEAKLSIGLSARLCYRNIQKHLNILSSIDLLPAWGLLERATAATSLDAVEKHLIPEVTKQLSFEVCEHVLRQIPKLASASLVDEVFCLYLREWRGSASDPILRQGLGHLQLLNKAEIWTSAAELVAGVYGVMPEFVVDERQFELLAGLAVDNRLTPNFETFVSRDVVVSAVGQELCKDLEVYFEPLISSSVRPYVGVVAGLFGADVTPLAKSWLDPIGYDDYLIKLGWQDPGYEDSLERRLKWMGNKTVAQALNTLRISLDVLSGSHVSAQSLTGVSVQVRIVLESEIETLFIKSDRWEGSRCRVLMLPVIGLLAKEAKQQREILVRTAEGLLKDLYNQQQANLSELSALAGEADQITLDVARTLILEGLPQSLRSLPGILKNKKLAQALIELDDRRRDYASAKRAGRSKANGAADNLEAARVSLGELVESDQEVQNAVLAGIKSRVAHNQYEVSSIPFEIFQNADDAVGEMQLLQKTDHRSEFDSTAIGQLVVHSTDKTIRLAHWGRPINYAGRLANYRPDFANDLERMLMLGASAKDENESVTGKFGLGFKSVFLASSNPRVWSGDLCFEVLAGCLPVKWTASATTKRFYQMVQTPNHRGLRPTIIELPLDSDSSASEVIARFSGLAGLLPVFARKLRCVVVDDKSNSWQPRPLRMKGAELIEVGSVSLPVEGGWVQSRLLVFRVRSGSAVFRLGSGGIEEFDRKAQPAVPGIWVTAPTRGASARGVLLNASFQIDTGRASLEMGKSEEINSALTTSLANEVSRCLIKLHIDSETNWPALSVELGCSTSVSVAGFWYSLWSALLTEPPGQDAAMDVTLLDMFAHTLFCNVVKGSCRVPNGLKDENASLVDIEGICLSVNLTYLASVVPRLCNWRQFTDKYPILRWCTNNVCEWLVRSEVINNERIPSLGITEVLSVLPDGRLPQTEIRSLVDIIRAWPRNLGEEQQWREKLWSILLLSEAGTWVEAKLLIRGDGEDSDLLKRFAPKGALLHSDYAPGSEDFQFIEKYLLSWEIDPNALARWCLEADDDEAKTAVAKWLVRNIFGPTIHSLSYLRHLGGWLFELNEESAILVDLPLVEARLLISKLQLVDIPLHPPKIYPNLDLESIYDWWSDRGSHWLSEYDKRLWPSRFDRQALMAEPYDRTAWLTLFSIGLFRRYGRVTDQQHSGFLDFLSNKGWWDTICKIHPEEGSEAWMNILREYGETQQTETLFELWMDSFPRMYRMARWLDTYVHLFQTLDYRNSNLAEFLLSPASDTSLSGSGLEAPTLSGMLRLGQHLVIRELLRLGALTSVVARQNAFAPRSAVIDLMSSFGCGELSSSSEIYNALVDILGEDKACFGGAYDIPLQLITSSEKARIEAEQWAKFGNLIEQDE